MNSSMSLSNLCDPTLPYRTRGAHTLLTPALADKSNGWGLMAWGWVGLMAWGAREGKLLGHLADCCEAAGSAK